MTNGVAPLHKRRPVALLPALIALALPPTGAVALSLGEPSVHSALNQPFNATVPLTLDAGESLANLHINGKLSANPAGNSEANSPALHLTLERSSGNNEFTVHVISDETMQAAGVKLRLSLSDGQGQTAREYSLLIDPPRSLTDPVSAATESRTPNSASATRYGPVKANETLWSIAGAINPYADISQAQMTLALYQANPQAFYQPTINALKSGEYLSIPAHEEIARIPAGQAGLEVKAELAQLRDARSLPQSEAVPAQQPAGAPAGQTASEPDAVLPTVDQSRIPAQPKPAPATPAAEANNNDQTASDSQQPAAVPTEEAAPTAPPTSPETSLPPPVADVTEKTASVAASIDAIPEKTPEPAADAATFSNIRMIGAAALALLLSLTIRAYLAQRSRKQTLEAERQARQAEVTRQLLKDKMLADIRYPQKQTDPDPVRATETPVAELSVPDMQINPLPNQTGAEPAIAATPAPSSGLSLLPLEETPDSSGGYAPVPAVPPSVAEETTIGSLTTNPDTNISAVISDLTDMDENETKLDLALTYAAMGDSKSAGELLTEIIADGSGKQREEARFQLAKLGKDW
ncbi:FimV/HubP family polar landmark protein [Candidatus Methylospira mobilis]|uniref:FimV/HubP family polar landmark protein n=1 Tax=Candidatus Methylospira mobilis TaxID=1808979 RepID=UPI0028EC26EE|nr:FimV/HubP family polar landmark protein [Candidatus Methylospira mobilis]WNV03468.1 FimV/HubP family polar landmark protein [Candidatus Methylospira mobilis]